MKCLVQAQHDNDQDVASREIQNLIVADQHPNIVRWYDTAYVRGVVYISLERCDCNLYDLIHNQMYSELFPLWKPNGYPSSNLLGLMREIGVGLKHLHKLRIIH
ncbi:putative protein kinase IRE1 family [Helianthus annuus]|nr:putative protein kinase IRE1 family [Helianthus annuus]